MSTDRKEYMRKWREAHPGYNTQYSRKWRANNHERFNELCRNYQAEHREDQRKRMNDYHQTKEGRATNLLASYVQADLEYRGVRPKLTREDIMRICFSDDSKCLFCGDTDWTNLGLDRINNDLPHDVGNVICSCSKCNMNKHRRTLGEYLTEKKGMSWESWMKMNNMTYASGFFTITYPENENNCG